MTLRVEKLCKAFKETKALESLDFTLEKGGSVALLGPNGAGKSTAIKIMTTLLRPDAGSMFYDNEDLLVHPAKIRALVGYVSQEMAMDKLLTGAEFIRFCAGLIHLPWSTHKDRALGLLDEMGLTEAANRQVGTYSGGMKRRLDLAAALLHNPNILILDEPTTGLDIDAREKIWSLIKAFLGRGGSLILASHDFREVDELAANVLILAKGKVIERGTPAELRAKVGDFIVRLKTTNYMSQAEVEKVRVALKSFAGLTPQEDKDHAAFVYRGPLDMRALQESLLSALKTACLNAFSLNVQQPDLEDVYRFATGDLT